MKASQLITQLSTLLSENGDLDIILQADHHGYETVRGVEKTFYSEEWESTEDCDTGDDDYKLVFVVYS